MSIKFPVSEVDQLTQACTDLYCCTYLLQILEEYAITKKHNFSKTADDTCIRLFLYDAQMRALDIMQSALDRTTAVHMDKMRDAILSERSATV